MYHTTVHGLEKWYQHVFENLGWMVLAKRDKRTQKLSSYKQGVTHLHEALVERLKTIQDPDKKYDLEQLLLNVKTLEKQIAVLKL